MLSDLIKGEDHLKCKLNVNAFSFCTLAFWTFREWLYFFTFQRQVEPFQKKIKSIKKFTCLYRLVYFTRCTLWPGWRRDGTQSWARIFLASSIIRYVLTPLETPLCLWLGENPFLQIGYEALCHAMTCSPLDALSPVEILHPVHLLHVLLAYFPVVSLL